MSDGPYGPPSPGDPQQPPGPPGPPSGPPGPPTPPGPPGPPPSAPGSPAGYPTAPPGPPPGYQQPGYQQPAYPPPGQPAYPPAGQPGYPPAQGGYGQPGGYPPPKKSSNKGLWIGLGIAGVVLLLLCCGGIGWVVYSGFKTAQEEIEKIEEETNDFPTDFPTPSLTPGSSTEESTGEVGTPIRVGDVEFTVTAKPACGAGALGSGATKAEPLRGQFCQVPIRLANKGAESISWPCIRITMASTQDPKNYFSTSGNRAVMNSSTCNVDLGVGKTWDGKIVFDIEDGDTPSEITFTEDYQDYAVVTL